MADPSSQTTNDTTDWHDASMANDDSSVMTEVMGAKTSSKAPQMVEKVVKFVFRVNNEQASTIAQRHVLLLKTIDDAFGTEVMIYTNANKKMKKFKLAGFPEYQRMFSIHHKRGNSKQKHKRTATYTVISPYPDQRIAPDHTSPRANQSPATPVQVQHAAPSLD